MFSYLFGSTEAPKVTDKKDAPTPNISEDWEDVPKKRVTWQDEAGETLDLFVITPANQPEAKEAKITGFQEVDYVTEEETEEGFTAVDVGVTSNKPKPAKKSDTIHIIFNDGLVSVTKLLSSPKDYMAGQSENTSQLRDAAMHTVIAALGELTGIRFDAFHSSSGFDFRSAPVHVKDERPHFAFMDSFIMLTPSALRFLRKKVTGDGMYQYVITDLNPHQLIKCVQSQEIAAAKDPKLLEKTRIQHRLLTTYFELNPKADAKDTQLASSDFIISEPSVTVPHPHLRTRFISKDKSEAQFTELKKLEKKLKAEVRKEKQDYLPLVDLHVKLCLKKATETADAESPNWHHLVKVHLADFNYEKERETYIAKLTQLRRKESRGEDEKGYTVDEVEQSIIDDANKTLGIYREFEEAFPEAPKADIVAATTREKFFQIYGVFEVNSKQQKTFAWKSEDKSGQEERTPNATENSLQQHTIRISDQDRFVKLLKVVEPRLDSFTAFKSKMEAEDTLPMVPVYEQAQLIHQNGMQALQSKIYRLNPSNDLARLTSTGAGHLLKQRFILELVDEKSLPQVITRSDDYRQLLQQRFKDLEKLNSEQLKAGEELIETAVDCVIAILDEVNERRYLQQNQLELLAECHALFSRCMKKYNHFITNLVNQFDFAQPILTSYKVKFSDATPVKFEEAKQAAPAVTVTPQAAPTQPQSVAAPEKAEVKETTTVVMDAPIKELLEKLEQFKQTWGSQAPERLIANLISRIHAHLSSTRLMRTIMTCSMQYAQKANDPSGCNAELAEMLRKTLAQLKVDNADPAAVLTYSANRFQYFAQSPSPYAAVIAPSSYTRRTEYLPRPAHTQVQTEPKDLKDGPVHIEESKTTPPPRFLSAPPGEPNLYDIDFLEEFNKQLEEAGANTAVLFDQDQTLFCQHTGSHPFNKFASDRYLETGKYDQVLSHYNELKEKLAKIPASDKGIVTFNQNFARARMVATAYGINPNRAFAISEHAINYLRPDQVTSSTPDADTSWPTVGLGFNFQQTNLTTAEQQAGVGSLESMTGLTLQQICLIRDAYKKMENPRIESGKNLHIVFQLIASNLERHKQGQPFLQNMIFVDDDNNNIRLGNQHLAKFLAVVSQLKELENVPGIKTLKDIKIHCVLPKLTPRQDPSQRQNLFRPRAKYVKQTRMTQNTLRSGPTA